MLVVSGTVFAVTVVLWWVFMLPRLDRPVGDVVGGLLFLWLVAVVISLGFVVLALTTLLALRLSTRNIASDQTDWLAVFALLMIGGIAGYILLRENKSMLWRMGTLALLVIGSLIVLTPDHALPERVDVRIAPRSVTDGNEEAPFL